MNKKYNKWTHEHEQYLIDVHNKVKTNGGSKEQEFQRLEGILGRNSIAISRKYYSMFPSSNSKNEVDSKQINKEKVVPISKSKSNTKNKQASEFKYEKILWTKERVEILKEEINKKIKKGYSVTKMVEILSKKLNMGYSTVHLKINRLKEKFKTKNLVELYNVLLNQGHDLDLMNDDSMIKKYKKRNKVHIIKEQSNSNNVVEQSNVVNEKQSENQNVDKLTFWEIINPFARLRKLEKQIQELKSNIQK